MGIKARGWLAQRELPRYTRPVASGANEPLQVLVVGEDPLARNGLANIVGGQGLTVIGPVSPLDAVQKRFNAGTPDVAAWDLGAEANSASDRLREFDAVTTPVLVLAPDESSASDAITAGARGALLRDADGGQLATALRAIVHGNIVIDEALSGLVRARANPSATVESLTVREMEVLQLLAQGLANKEIAARLGVSEHTAKFHVNAILGKLGAQSRTEAVVRAARQGLLIL